MVNILFIISQRNFNDQEYSVTRKILEDGGVNVTLASIEKEETIGMHGLRVNPDKTVRDVDPSEYDGLVVIGGSGSPKLADYPEVLEVIRNFAEKKKNIAAICLAPIVLAKAGVMKDVMSTVFPSDWAITVLKTEGAHYFAKNVVENGNIVTADGPSSAEEFGRTILKKFKLQK